VQLPQHDSYIIIWSSLFKQALFKLFPKKFVLSEQDNAEHHIADDKSPHQHNSA
jgi:hypothetical protein